MTDYKYSLVRKAEIWITANNSLQAQAGIKRLFNDINYLETLKWEEICLLEAIMEVGDSAETIELPSGDIRKL